MKTICLNPTCGRDVYARGLCISDYQVATRLVRASRVSWEELEAAGKAIPSKGCGQRSDRTAWFLSDKPAQAD